MLAQLSTVKSRLGISTADTTQDDLRVHIMSGPTGEMDAYQILLVIAAHTGRHVQQINEVN